MGYGVSAKEGTRSMSTPAYIAFVALCLGVVVVFALWCTRRDKQARIDKALHERALRKERMK